MVHRLASIFANGFGVYIRKMWKTERASSSNLLPFILDLNNLKINVLFYFSFGYMNYNINNDWSILTSIYSIALKLL